MEKPRASTIAWSVIAASTLAYEYLAPKDELLSEACDRGLERPIGRFFVYGAIGSVALHLANVIPEQIDIFHHASKYFNRETQT